MGTGYDPNVTNIKLVQTLWANLPPASDNDGRIFYCPDAAGGKALVISDGTTYRVFARGTQSKILTTDALGEATWTFTQAFPTGVVPVVMLTPVNGLAQAMDVSLKADPTNTGCVVKVRQSQTLPAALTLLSQLLSFNVFGGTGISGVKVHALAFVPNNP